MLLAKYDRVRVEFQSRLYRDSQPAGVAQNLTEALGWQEPSMFQSQIIYWEWRMIYGRRCAPSSVGTPSHAQARADFFEHAGVLDGIITPDLIAVLDKAALAQAQARLADARAKGEAALVNADYAQKTADAAAPNRRRLGRKQRADADRDAGRTLTAKLDTEAVWYVARNDTSSSEKNIEDAVCGDAVRDAEKRLAAARDNLAAARSQSRHRGANSRSEGHRSPRRNRQKPILAAALESRGLGQVAGVN